jgi:predicted patatin/cPLA2 family phospholipase
MRGVYTSGVLEAFAESGLSFPHVVTCSAGACAAASFLAGQPERNRRVYLDFLDGDKLVRFRRLLVGGDIMDIDYLTDEVTVSLCPLDLEAIRRNPSTLHIAVTDWETGEVRYLDSHHDDLLTAFRATCALPFFYRGEVFYQGRRYVDGGVGDPVGIAKAIELGAREVVVVLTSSIEARGRRKWRFPGSIRLFSRSPAIRRALLDRYKRYREAAALIATPPKGVDIHVVRPSRPLPVKRTTTDRAHLEQGLDLGYEDGKNWGQSLIT